MTALRRFFSGHSGCCLSKAVQLLCINHVGSQQMLLANAILVDNVSGEHEMTSMLLLKP